MGREEERTTAELEEAVEVMRMGREEEGGDGRRERPIVFMHKWKISIRQGNLTVRDVLTAQLQLHADRVCEEERCSSSTQRALVWSLSSSIML